MVCTLGIVWRGDGERGRKVRERGHTAMVRNVHSNTSTGTHYYNLTYS